MRHWTAQIALLVSAVNGVADLGRQKMANTTVVLSGTIPNAGPPAVARSRPLPLTTDDPSDNAPLPQYQPRYDDNRPPLPFPFSIFGR